MISYWIGYATGLGILPLLALGFYYFECVVPKRRLKRALERIESEQKSSGTYWGCG